MFGKDGVPLKGQRTGVVRIFYRELKKRESQGQAVIVTIDEYLTSQVRSLLAYMSLWVLMDICLSPIGLPYMFDKKSREPCHRRRYPTP